MRSLFFQTLAIQMLVRFWLIWLFPHNFAFDGFQRWAGKEFLLIRDWMPATQFFIYCAHLVGLDIMGTKLLLSLLGAIAVASTTLIVSHLFNRQAGLIFVGFGFFAPFLTWSGTLYQEGTFLALSMSSIALALYLPERKRWIADILAGSVALSRYEGWPFVLLYILWRRQKIAGIALWGMGLWIAIKLLGVESVDPSPISYADWEGMSERFNLELYLQNGRTYLQKGFLQGALWIWIGSLFGIKKALQKDLWLSVLLLLLLGSQLAAVLGWVAGLETVILRMLIIPTFLLGIFAAGLPQKWFALPIFSICFALFGINNSFWQTRRNTKHLRHEQTLIEEISNCSDCRFLVYPRRGMGTRDRHDGCEILQGISSLKHPHDFVCALWEEDISTIDATHKAVWTDRTTGYQITPIQPVE